MLGIALGDFAIVLRYSLKNIFKKLDPHQNLWVKSDIFG